MSTTDRRNFLKTTSQAAVAASTLAWAGAQVAHAASQRTVVALIGPGGMGSNHLQLLAKNKDVELAYVCDVDEQRLAAAVASAEKLAGRAPKPVKDLRRILDDPAVEAVWIATPDHWHGPATILACDAKKHVYVEKPCAHNIREGRLMIEAARRNDRVVQVGTQSRSTAHIRQAVDKLRAGAIGRVLVAKAWNSQLRGSIGHAKPSDPPATLDFDQWIGPAPMVPYQSNLLPSVWRWWHAFGAGDMGNDGVHDIDIACWGLGVDTHPTSVAALGGKYFFDDDQQFPDTQYAVFEYDTEGPQKRQLIFEQRIWSPYVQEGYENGNAFYGTEGMMLLGKRGGYRIYGKRNKLIEEVTAGSPDLEAHHANFLACMRDGSRPHADIEINQRSSTLCHLGNLAARFGGSLRFDPKTEQITGNSEAAPFVRRTYREGHWAVPRGV